MPRFLRSVTGRIGAVRPSATSLGGKLVWLLTAVGAFGAIAIMVLLALVITPSFGKLERTATEGHVERTRAALTAYAGKVESAVRDYGDWNDSYAYMEHQTRAFEHESFSTLAMTNLGINGMAYIANDGHIVIARWLDSDAQVDDPAMRARMIAAIRQIDLNKAIGQGSSSDFYMRLGDQLAAIGVARVRKSDGSGTPRGYVLMARRLTSEQLGTLLQVNTRLDVRHPVARETITHSSRMLDIAVPIRGAKGQPVAAARYQVPRDLSLLGRKMLLLATAGSVVLLLLVLIVLRRAIGRMVLRPLKHVEEHMQRVRASGSLSMFTDLHRRDEIGSLGTSFNDMLRQLKDLREQLEVQSFKLGRSESAVAVMHNVRNALNPLSTILSQGLTQTSAADQAMLDRALSELTRDDLPPARRQKLVAFIAAAVQAEDAARGDRKRQLEMGREALHNVLEIIGKQQADAHERPRLELCDATDIVAQNAIIARYSGEQSIAFSFPSKPHWVMASRVVLSQVVGNLLSNAAEAIAATDGKGGSITVTIKDTDDGKVEILITDSGDGFDPALAPKLFQRGFSTRHQKSGGLGLHWCSNAMLSMQGSLALESEGQGCGATARLTLGAPEKEMLEAAA